MEDFLRVLILGHITGVKDIGHQQDWELRGNDIAMVQVDEGGEGA